VWHAQHQDQPPVVLDAVHDPVAPNTDMSAELPAARRTPRRLHVDERLMGRATPRAMMWATPPANVDHASTGTPAPPTRSTTGSRRVGRIVGNRPRAAVVAGLGVLVG
jgi:hypothetical protein